MPYFPLTHRLRNRVRRSFLRKVVVAYRHRGVTENDVILASYPKSGTTWMTFMLAELLWHVGREQTLLDNRFLPTIGNQSQAEKRLPDGGRMIRSHERYRPIYKKAIYLVRDGRDVAVSMYWHIKRATGMQAEFGDFLDFYLQGRLTGAGAWHDHVCEWLDSPAFQAGNVLMARYEDMKRDAAGELRRAANFLGLQATEEQLSTALEAASMESMKERENATQGLAHLETGGRIPVVRKGIVGDWRNYFSAQDLERFYHAAAGPMTRLGYDVDPVSQS